MSVPSLDELMARAQGRPTSPQLAVPAAIPGTYPLQPPAPSPDMVTFLRTVLPQSGQYVLASIASSGARHAQFGTIERLVYELLQRSGAGENVYFAVASYRASEKPSRKAENVENLRCLFLDIDCGKGEHTYASESELEAALSAFVKVLGIEPTVVHSGTGRHVYWPFDRDLTPAEWRPLAEALKSYSSRWGLLADHGVTADAARVLRAPATRTKHGGSARLLKLEPAVSIEQMQAALDSLRLAFPGGQRAPAAPLQAMALQVPSVLAGITDHALSQNLGRRSDWLQTLPVSRQLQLLDEMMGTCPDSFWSQEPWWAQVVHAIAALHHLSQDLRLDLLVKHSMRSPKWSEGGWSRDRLFREKWRGANGTASLSALLQTAEQHGWQRPVDAVIPQRFTDRGSLVSYLAERYVYIAEQGACLNRKTRALISGDAVVEAEEWRTPYDAEKPINLRRLLRSSVEVERVDAIGYQPGEGAIFVHGARRIANLYQSWSPAPTSPTDVERAVVNEFLAHLTPDAEGLQFRRWIWDALAWLVQHPEARLPVAVLLTGAPGCGKSTLLETIPRLLFGPHNVASVTAGELDSPFNDWLGGARILTMPELRMGSARDARRLSDSLKPIITSPTVRIHPKGSRGYEQGNVVSLFASSNHGDAVHLEDDDRRWVVYESPAGRMPDQLAERIYSFLEGPRAAGALRSLFESTDVSQFKPHALPAASSAKRRMLEASRSPIEDSLVGRYERGEFPFDRPLILIEECRAALAEDGIEWKGNSGQSIARVLQARPISAEKLRRVRVQPRSCGGAVLTMPPVHSLMRCTVYVARRNGAENWRDASDEFVRGVLQGKGDRDAGTGMGQIPAISVSMVETQH